MPRPSFTLRIPAPCAESWAAMTPTGAGRHCAACQKTVIDFTQKTDAEILVYLAQTAGETCGRFGNDQLDRPLLPAASCPPAGRWRTWLALLLAAWGMRTGAATAAGTLPAGPPSATHPRKKAGTRPHPARPASRLLRGTVHDAATHEPLAGVAVFLKGENRSATTDSAGHFSLRLPPPPPHTKRALVLHYTGYQSETVGLAATEAALSIALQPDPAAAGATIVGYGVQTRQDITGGAIAIIREVPAAKPYPWRPRSFWRWLTQPFRH